MERFIRISTIFLVMMGLSVPLFAQLGIRFSVGGGISGSTYSGRGGSVPPIDATYLESDVDVPPQYPGGADAIAEHFRTDSICGMGPVNASCREKPEVLVWFIVEHDGSVHDAWLDRGGCEELQARAVCSVLDLQGWLPGRKGDYTVRTRMRIPVRYTSQ